MDLRKFIQFINKHYKVAFFIFLLLVGLANFWLSFRNPFLIDDGDHYQNFRKQNPKFFFYVFIPQLTEKGGFQNFEYRWGYYRPLAHFLYSVEASYFNENTFPYQVVSFSVFILASFTIFLLLFSLTSNRFISSAASLLYLLHPFNGLCVNYKTAFVFSLQIIFLNLIFLYVHKIASKQVAFKWDQYALYLILYLFSLLFHELVLFFPLILIVYGCFVLPSWRNFLLGFGFGVCGFIYFTILPKLCVMSGSVLKAVFAYKITWYQFCGAYARIIRWVTLKLIYPEKIFLQWATPIDKHMAGQWLWVFGFYLFIYFFFLWFFLKRSRLLALFWFMFGIGFILSAPASYRIIGTGLFYFEPHWIYYTNIGLFALAGWGLDKTRIVVRWLPYALVVVISLYLATFSFAQNKLYNNLTKYFKLWSQETPGFDFPALGVCYNMVKHNQVDKAIKCYEPWTDSERRPIVYGNLANLYFLKKDYKKSEEYLKKNLALNPADIQALSGLATLAIERKDYDQALDYINQAQMYDIFSLDLIRLKCLIYEKQNKYKEIFQILDEADQNYNLKDFTDIYRIKIFFKSGKKDLAVRLAKDILNRSQDFQVLTLAASILKENQEDELGALVQKKADLFKENGGKR